MKSIGTWFTFTLFAATAAHAAVGSDEVKKLREATEVVRGLHDLQIAELPADAWRDAQCIVVIPDMKKVGLIIGGEFGRGVASCRNATGWSAPAFFKLRRGTWGWQAGGAEIDLVLLVMNREGQDRLLTDNVSLGASASAAAGSSGRSASAGTDIRMSGGILSYSRASGLFAGVDVSGGVLNADEDANEDVYGRELSARQILIERVVQAPPEAAEFLEALRTVFGESSSQQ